MKIGVFGTGRVGETIGTKLVSMGHEVRMGSRSAGNEKATAWAAAAGARASSGTFADAAAFGDLLFNCTPGAVSLEVLESAGREHLRGKVLVDVANPLVFTKSSPPSLFVTNDDSLGERLQRAYPELLLVKSLNTVHCSVMVDPSRVRGDHTMFLCGNDAGAKTQVRELLRDIGWRDVIDLGDITNARATEALLPLWGVLGTGDFNLKVVR